MATCETCRFCGVDYDSEGNDQAACRRDTPKKSIDREAVWPLVMPSRDWCGQYEVGNAEEAELSWLLSRLRASDMTHDDIARRLRAMLNAAGGQ